jgi:hypothetical protein
MKECIVFICEYCNKKYLDKIAAENCENQCKNLAEFKKNQLEWFEKNPSKFKEGDIVQIIYPEESNINMFFQVKKIHKAFSPPTWSYEGYVGVSENCVYNPYRTDIVDETDLALKMTKKEFDSKCNALKQKLGNINCTFDICKNTNKFGIEIKIFENESN